MKWYFFVIYLVNCSVASIAVILFLLTKNIRNEKNKLTLPRNLRIYIEIFTYPPCLILSLSSISTSLFYIIFQSDVKPNVIIPIVLSFVAQIFRMGLLMIVLERIMASIFIKKYNNNSNLGLFLMITVTILSTIAYVGFVLYTTFDLRFLQLFTTYFAFAMHVLNLITCRVLYLINRNAYKRRAYQSTLKERYQILENVKVLSFIYPTIFIFTIIAPTGPLIIFISSFVIKDPLPPSMFHLTYNIAFVIMMLYRVTTTLKEKRIKRKTGPIYAVAVISPLGKRLPASQQIDTYFENLQKQWE